MANVDKDTFLRVDDLNMEQSKSYSVVVTATDEMDSCTVMSSLFTVDNTPPTPGVVGVGQNLTDKVRTILVCKVCGSLMAMRTMIVGATQTQFVRLIVGLRYKEYIMIKVYII